jgi:hypothetical protein
MRTRRDMTSKQFRTALDKYGFGAVGAFGYVSLPSPFGDVYVSIFNGGPSYRGMLAYLLQQVKRREQKRRDQRRGATDRGNEETMTKDELRIGLEGQIESNFKAFWESFANEPELWNATEARLAKTSFKAGFLAAWELVRTGRTREFDATMANPAEPAPA